jgi:CO/xanthine dehydrogenase Mo-binding subunit
VLHPQGLQSQTHSGSIMGFGLALRDRIVYDPALGLPATVSFNQAKPSSWLDVPVDMKAAAVELPDRFNPIGAKGMGEPIMGAAASAVINAVSDALNGHYFHRTPIVPDMIINAMADKPQSYRPLQANTM